MEGPGPGPGPPGPQARGATGGGDPEPPRDWAGLPGPLLATITGKLVAAEPRGHGLTLMAITCKGWRSTLKRDAITAAGGPEAWRDWGNLYGEGPPRAVLAKVARALVAQKDAAWEAWLRWDGFCDELSIVDYMEARKSLPSGLLAFARVCKEWRKAQLEVGGPLRTRVVSDVLLPGRVALAKWALAEGCPTEDADGYCMCFTAAGHGNLELVRWLVREQDFALHEDIMWVAARSGNLRLVQWLRDEGCPWDTYACAHASRHLEVLRWLRANGCPWDARTCDFAVDRGRPVLSWARANGAPWTAKTRDEAAAELGYTDDFGNVVDDHY